MFFEVIPSEVAALYNLLAHAGVQAPHTGQSVSEALLFGVGGGIGLGYFVYESGDYTALFIATRITTQETPQSGFFKKICDRMGVKTSLQTSSSPAAAERKLQEALAQGKLALVYVDPRKLPYPWPPAAYHALMVSQYDLKRDAFVVADRSRQLLVLSANELHKARDGEGAIKFRALAFEGDVRLDGGTLQAAVVQGLRDCVQQMTAGYWPANFRNNFGLRALDKWAGLLTDLKDKRGWPKFFPPGERLFNALFAGYEQIEFRGGGSAQRGLFSRFLEEVGAMAVNLGATGGTEEGKELLGAAEGWKVVAERYRQSERSWKALAEALLPDGVELFRKVKELRKQKEELFLDQGLAALDEVEKIDKSLESIKEVMKDAFPMEQREVTGLLEEIRQRVLEVHAAEERGLSALSANLLTGSY